MVNDDLPLNPTMDAIAELVGEDLATKLSMVMGGRRIRIPVRAGGHHTILANILGVDAAAKISEAYGGMNFDVAISAGKRARIVEMRQRGVSVSVVAQKIGCTESYVYKVMREDAPEADAPLPLFESLPLK